MTTKCLYKINSPSYNMYFLVFCFCDTLIHLPHPFWVCGRISHPSWSVEILVLSPCHLSLYVSEQILLWERVLITANIFNSLCIGSGWFMVFGSGIHNTSFNLKITGLKTDQSGSEPGNYHLSSQIMCNNLIESVSGWGGSPEEPPS